MELTVKKRQPLNSTLPSLVLKIRRMFEVRCLGEKG